MKTLVLALVLGTFLTSIPSEAANQNRKPAGKGTVWELGCNVRAIEVRKAITGLSAVLGGKEADISPEEIQQALDYFKKNTAFAKQSTEIQEMVSNASSNGFDVKDSMMVDFLTVSFYATCK